MLGSAEARLAALFVRALGLLLGLLTLLLALGLLLLLLLVRALTLLALLATLLLLSFLGHSNLLIASQGRRGPDTPNVAVHVCRGRQRG